MSEKRKEFSLDALRTDGWFERIGEGIGSFQALCEIVGERFFAFSIIVGARITALTVDRRSPDQTLVDFVVGVGENDGDLDPQRLTLADFRRRLVGALLVEEDREAPRPVRETDVEAIQLFIGVRYLLLAPVYGYSLRKLALEGKRAELVVLHDGEEEQFDLDTFRMRIRALVREELDRVATGARSAIDLSKVAEAEAAAIRKDWPKVIALLGAWPAPLAIFLREQAEEVFRIGIQYAQEGVAAAELFRRLGEALLLNDRAGEAIGPLRRAIAFGGALADVMPPLARAFLKRERYVAAYACVRDAFDAGVAERDLADEVRQIEAALGPSLTAWRARKLETKRRDSAKSNPG
jgi:hypothetical protein